MKKARKLEEVRKLNRTLLADLEEDCRAYAVAVNLLKEQKPGTPGYHDQLEVLQGALLELRSKAKAADKGLSREHKLSLKLAAAPKKGRGGQPV
jgi:hypothetical protein